MGRSTRARRTRAPRSDGAPSVPSRRPYSLSAAPHPAELTSTGASPGIDAITRTASACASSCSPACVWSAPQHPPPAPGIGVRHAERVEHPCRRPVRVAEPRIHHAPREQPRVGAGRHDRQAPDAAGVGSARRASARGAAAVRAASAVEPASSTRCIGSTRNPNRCHHGVIRPVSARCSRVVSIRCPKGTPLGHAGSQPRHWTHVDMKCTKSSSIGDARSSTARIASIRPRGDNASSPVARKVGQCGRHRPHCTHVFSSSGSRLSVIARSIVGSDHHARRPHDPSNRA